VRHCKDTFGPLVAFIGAAGLLIGAPKGNSNALKHGNYTAKEQVRRLAMKYLLRRG
jgi:hypothetical protein